MFIGRVSTKHILLTIGIASIPVLILFSVAVNTYDKKEHRAKDIPSFFAVGRVPTWIGRIQTFMYSSKEDANEKLYQINQAKIAIAKGSWFGLGPGNSQARNFLPHSYSDFIYAIILEEYGLLGGIFIVFIYLYKNNR